jgi:5-methylcytosine-specific restriction protein B
MMFTWIPIYTELAKKILPFRNRQNELISMLKELEAKGLPVVATVDQNDQKKKIPLTTIDPFTFYASFNHGIKTEKRQKILTYLKTALSLTEEVPTDFEGIPVVHSQSAWFFPYSSKRKADDIPSLWLLAEGVVQGPPEKLDPKMFERCLQIASVGPAKLTMGMYWLNPKHYIAWDAKNRELFKLKGIEGNVDTLSAYLDLIRLVNAELGTDYPTVSRMAWETVTGRSDFAITPEQMENLWTRFHRRIKGFTDFESPGDELRKEELDYKRNALKRYQEEVGNTELRKWVETGEGNKALIEISKRIQMNLVAFQSWRLSIGSNDKQSSAVLKAYLDAAEKPYAGPSTIEPIIKATVAQGLKPSWDTLSTLLWAMRPTDFFPMKINFYRELANDLGHVLPEGRPTPETFDKVLKFGQGFWTALKPQKPKDWVDVQSFMWVVCPSNFDGEAKQYWAGGFQWGDESRLEEFVQGNFWEIGWEKDDKDPAAKKAWDHFGQVKAGDEFAIKGFGEPNDLRIYYIGKVLNKTDDGRLNLQKIDRPLYEDTAPAGLAETSWSDALVPIKAKSVIDIIFHGESPIDESSQESINLILYGPPGTGKTYQTVERAVKIIDPGFEAKHSGDRVALKRRFDELVLQGRVEFITFHQSYSYEDFVEGIRPVLDTDDEGGPPRYECRPGSFKRLAFNALFDCLEKAEAAKGLVPFDVLWQAMLAKIESDPEAKYPGLSKKTSYQFALTQKGNIEGTNVLSDRKFLCSRKILEQVFDAKRSQDSVSVSDVMEVVARGCHSQLVAAVFNELRRVEKSQFLGKVQKGRQMPYTEGEKSDIVQRFLTEGEKSGYKLKAESDCTPYVLVIDEINRGNISKILGELITLIEPDKRLRAGDKQNSLIVTLPYSGEKFAVPANLYVLATMNTADKSIALVDVALRRRFDFDELQVDLTLCQGLNEKMQSALQELNRRIASRKDRDHQIGHAYFMSVTDEASFNKLFRKRIIPLLQEYFYNDWDGLRYVLGENSIAATDGQIICRVKDADVKEARTKWQWFFDSGAADMNCLETLYGNYKIL